MDGNHVAHLPFINRGLLRKYDQQQLTNVIETLIICLELWQRVCKNSSCVKAKIATKSGGLEDKGILNQRLSESA